MNSNHSIGLRLLSTLRADATLQLSIEELATPEPGTDEVVVRMEAVPINPSDMGTLLGAADIASASIDGPADRPVTTLHVPEPGFGAMRARIGKALGVGLEGAGRVVAAGSSAAAQALLGRDVAVLADSLVSQFRCVDVRRCYPLPLETTPRQGASFFVNPLTALGMTETMRLEGHRALIHTAAASHVGRMLNRLCLRDGIPLVSVVRRAEHVELLRAEGARFVVNTTSESFESDLVAAIRATGATLAFDATGGGTLASQILQAMEAAIAGDADLGRYGSTVHKQVYLYGGLDTRPTELRRTYGMAWGIGGWLVMSFLNRVGPEAAAKLKDRVATELSTTFRTDYAQEVSLVGTLRPENIALYGGRATGGKFVINPSRIDS